MRIAVLATWFLLLVGNAHAKPAPTLWWDTKKIENATCLYGEITVLATHHAIYYSGANWHPGQPAGGYCGIQHNGPKEKRTIFSIWDTSPKLHPHETRADPKTIFNRFGGEGEGAHTHMLWDWQPGDTFQFYVEKRPGADPGTTDARYYIFDREAKAWRHSATINSPNGDAKSEASTKTISGGGLASFLENYMDKDKDVPKVALYRLWLGTKPDDLKCLSEAKGTHTWGKMHDCYFLAEGSKEKLDETFANLKDKYGSPEFGKKGARVGAISDRALADGLKQQLKSLPEARTVQEK